MAPSNPNRKSRNDEGDRNLDDLVLRFDEDWTSHNTPPSIQVYLNKVDPKQRPSLVRELVLVDLEHRWKRQDYRPLESYAKCHPELQGPEKCLPVEMVLEQFKLARELQLSPEIRTYLSYAKTQEDRGKLFWKLALIDFDKQSGRDDGPLIEHYRQEFRNLVNSQDFVPQEMVVKQFEKDWDSFNPAKIKEYLGYGNPMERSILLTQLVILDMTKHWSSGNPRWLQDYLEVYPELLESDHSIPIELITREKSLSVATVISGKRFGARIVKLLRNKRIEATVIV